MLRMHLCKVFKWIFNSERIDERSRDFKGIVMKTMIETKKTVFSLLFFALLVLFAGGCANGGGSSSTPAVALSVCNTVGYVNTAYGCLPQATCQAGYGLYNNQCVPGTLATTTGVCSAGYVMYNNQCVAQSTLNSSLTSSLTSTTTAMALACQSSCPSGYTATTYGCLPQYYCSSCYGYTQGYCFPGAYATSGTYYLGF